MNFCKMRRQKQLNKIIIFQITLHKLFLIKQIFHFTHSRFMNFKKLVISLQHFIWMILIIEFEFVFLSRPCISLLLILLSYDFIIQLSLQSHPSFLIVTNCKLFLEQIMLNIIIWQKKSLHMVISAKVQIYLSTLFLVFGQALLVVLQEEVEQHALKLVEIQPVKGYLQGRQGMLALPQVKFYYQNHMDQQLQFKFQFIFYLFLFFYYLFFQLYLLINWMNHLKSQNLMNLNNFFSFISSFYLFFIDLYLYFFSYLFYLYAFSYHPSNLLEVYTILLYKIIFIIFFQKFLRQFCFFYSTIKKNEIKQEMAINKKRYKMIRQLKKQFVLFNKIEKKQYMNKQQNLYASIFISYICFSCLQILISQIKNLY